MLIHAAEKAFEKQINESLHFSYNTPILKLKASSERDDSDFRDEDLYGLSAILCSSIFNKNDQYFLPSELKAARNTPINKPINNYHIPNEILGHMVSSFFLDSDLNELSNDFDPTQYNCVHLGVHSYLYRFDDPIFSGLNDKLADIIKSIENEEMYVSMECIAKGFDYAIKSSSGVSVLTRTKDNSKLTANLRYFGGDGLYNGDEIGMCLRGVRFCGKGLVKNPANPQSIIFGYKMKYNENGQRIKSSEQNSQRNVYETKEEVNDIMTLEEIQKELEDVKTKLAASEQSVLTLTSEKDEVVKQLSDKDVSVNELTAKVAEFEKAKGDLETEINRLNRVNLLASKGFVGEDSDKLLTEYNSLNDEMFAKMLDLKLEAKNASKVETVVETNTTPDLEKVEQDKTLNLIAKTEDEGSVLSQIFKCPLSAKK